MTDRPQSPSADDEFLGRIRVARTLGSASELIALAAAALLGLLFVVQAGPQFEAGTRVLWAGALLVLVLGATVLNILELLGGSAEGSGSYGLVHEITGGVTSFLTGWSMLAISALAVGALARLGAEVLATWVHVDRLPVEVPAVFLVLLVVLIHLFGWGQWRSPARTMLVLAAAGLTVTLLSIVAVGPRGSGAQLLRPQQDTLAVAAHFALMFVGIEAILLSRRSVRNPRGDLPPAFAGALLTALALIGIPALLLAGAPIGAPQGLWQGLRLASVLPTFFVDVSVMAALLLSLSTVFMNGVRTINAMARRGGLPGFLRSPARPFPLPPGLFLAMAAAALVPLLLGSVAQIASAAAWLVLVTLILLSAAAIHSRLTEPERRRWIRLPLFPLVPGLALTGVLALLLHLPAGAHAVGLAWTAAGVVLYTLYAREQQVAAQAGVITFGREEAAEKPEGGYRVLVPLGEQKARRFALDLSVALARQLKGDVMPLQVIPIPDPLAMEEGRRLARERNTLFQWSLRRGSEAGVEVTPVTRLARSVAEGIIDTAIEEHCDLILLPWAIEDGEVERTMGSVIDDVAVRAPCDLAIVAYRAGQLEGGLEDSAGDEPARRSIDTILVPTAGGPHAPLAVGLALELAEEYGARVRSVYVGKDGLSEEDRRAGEARIHSTLEEMRTAAAEILHHDLSEIAITPDQVERQVVEAPDVVAGIVSASGQADLTFIGSSEESFIDQVLFGSIPRQVAAQASCPVVMVRRHRGLPRFWLERVWEAIFNALPTLSGAEKIDVYKQVRRGARPDVDFFIMMAVATLIATIGLMQGSAAVIIGSMLVAPLFTPILAVSLGVAQGDTAMLRVAMQAMVQGILLGIAVAIVTASASPLKIVTDEILLRTQPNLFDLGVALAAGVAGAYAIARAQVAAALPGVAIAAALVPPLGVVGFGVAVGDAAMALGAVLLVLTNLIAIALAGSITLLLLGFRPGRRAEREIRLRRGLIVSALLLLVIAVPLAAFFGRAIRQTRTQRAIREVVSEHFASAPSIRFVDFEFDSGGDMVSVEVTVWAEGALPEGTGRDLADELSEVFGRPVSLRIVAVQIEQFEAEAAREP